MQSTWSMMSQSSPKPASPREPVSLSSHLCCCFHSLFPRQNRIKPSEFSENYCEYLDVGPGRRLRIVHLDPNQSCDHCVLPRDEKDAAHNEEEAACEVHSIVSTDDSSMEDYWFKNWARPRLPQGGETTKLPEKSEEIPVEEKGALAAKPGSPIGEEFEVFVSSFVLKVLEDSIEEGTKILRERSSQALNRRKFVTEESNDSGVTEMESPQICPNHLQQEGYTNYAFFGSLDEMNTKYTTGYEMDLIAQATGESPLHYVMEPVSEDRCKSPASLSQGGELKPETTVMVGRCDLVVSSVNQIMPDKRGMEASDTRDDVVLRPDVILDVEASGYSCEDVVQKCEHELAAEAAVAEAARQGLVQSSAAVDEGTAVLTQDNEHTQSSVQLKLKPLLMFLHGVGSSADTWSTQLLYFAGVGYEVLAPDILGHGFSSAPNVPKAYKFKRLLKDLEVVFDQYVKDGRKCVVVGHSYGSSFATALARQRPQNVSSLVLISSGGPTPLAPHPGVFSLPVWMLSCIKPFLMCGFKREAFYSPRGKRLTFSEAFDVPSYVLRNVMRGQDWPEGDIAFHRRISSPTLLVYGMRDPFVTLVEECEMERTLPKAFLEVIPKAGHMVMLEAPRQLCHMIHKFILCWDGS